MSDGSDASNPPSPLQVVDAVKRFRQGDRPVTALAGVSLRVGRASLTAVMGQSGSGKSTLLHLAAGLTAADEGRVLVEGEDLGAMGDRRLTLFRRRRLGLVFQSFNLIPTLTAEENVALPLALDGRRDGSLDHARGLLERLGLGHRLGHRPDAMSGGEQQRVAVARALVADPALVLADEPTGNLDSVSGAAVCDLLRGLADGGRTIVLVTHEPSVAAHADRVVILRDGRLLDDFENPSRDAAAVSDRYRRAVA